MFKGNDVILPIHWKYALGGQISCPLIRPSWVTPTFAVISMHLQISSIHWGQRWSFEGSEESSHTSNTSICWYFFWNLPICTREFLCLKYKTSGWKAEHRKILCIFASVSSNESTRGSIIQKKSSRFVPYTRLDFESCTWKQEPQNLKACEQGLIAYRTYLGDWPYQREDSCHFSIRIEQIDKSESRDVCQQLPPGKTWQAPFLWPTYSAG